MKLKRAKACVKRKEAVREFHEFGHGSGAGDDALACDQEEEEGGQVGSGEVSEQQLVESCSSWQLRWL